MTFSEAAPIAAVVGTQVPLNTPADLVVTGTRVHTLDPQTPTAEAFAVTGGRIAAVGTADDIAALAGPRTEVLDAAAIGGRAVVPGLADVHIHLGLGGTQAVYELIVVPTDSLDTVLDKVRERAAGLGPDEWVVGGIVASPIIDVLCEKRAIERLDEAAGGRAVVLRDESLHNRWVSSRALELMGVTESTPDPDDGKYVRDSEGRLTGVLVEQASVVGEEAMQASIIDLPGRHRVAYRRALEIVNSYGITAAQDAALLEYGLAALAELDDAGALSARVVGSLPVRPFLDVGPTGDPLLAAAPGYRRERVRPDFVKFFLDGVPMTRTALMLGPYRCHGDHEDPAHRGEPFWSHDDLVGELRRCADLGLGAKLHCAGDGAMRMALDAIEQVRTSHGTGPRYQIAHVLFIDEVDLPRFAALDVVPDAAPYIWSPSPMVDSVAEQVAESTMSRIWPFRDLVESGALLAAGSDWPVMPLPNPWLGLGTMVTRSDPDGFSPGRLNGAQALSVEQALAAFTRNPAVAMGLGDITGALRPGLSADFAVLDRDPFTIDPDEIARTVVAQTWFEGRRVYEHAL